MTTFFTADTHFGHKNVIAMCNRPFSSVEEMDEALIRNWNKKVRPFDTVYHLGDFKLRAGASIRKYLDRLHGKVHLIRGNHDHKAGKLDLAGFASVDDLLLLKYGQRRVVLCHYAMRIWPEKHYGAIMLFGHSHGALPPLGRSFDVGVDSQGFKPISLEEVYFRADRFPVEGEG